MTRRPQSFAHAAALAGNVAGIQNPRGIDDGPYGGSSLSIGDETVGELLAGPVDNDHWSGVRLLDGSLAQTAHSLTQSKLWLPGQPSPMPLPVAPLGEVGKLGLVDRDITGPAPRGPFDKVAPSATATYPALWNHNAKQETRIVCEPDSQLRVRQGMEEKAAAVWTTASRAHLNRDFTFGSQALSVAFTNQPAAGGRVWPNVTFQDDRFDYAFVIWGNSTLGLLSHWWHSSRQQSSKASMTIRSAETFPVFDFHELSETQLDTAKATFDEFRELELQPAYLADADANRALLDGGLVCDLLGFDGEVYRAVRRLAAKWCAEPSVHGGKRRPANARYVE